MKNTVEVTEQTYSGRLFQREGGKSGDPPAPVLVLILRTIKVIPLFDLSEWDGSDVASME